MLSWGIICMSALIIIQRGIGSWTEEETGGNPNEKRGGGTGETKRERRGGIETKENAPAARKREKATGNLITLTPKQIQTKCLSSIASWIGVFSVNGAGRIWQAFYKLSSGAALSKSIFSLFSGTKDGMCLFSLLCQKRSLLCYWPNLIEVFLRWVTPCVVLQEEYKRKMEELQKKKREEEERKREEAKRLAEEEAARKKAVSFFWVLFTYYFINWCMRIKPHQCRPPCLSSICNSFVRLGLHNGQTACPQWEIVFEFALPTRESTIPASRCSSTVGLG